MPGLAGAFQDVYFHSHWVLFGGVVELIAGVIFLFNRFVPLALVATAAIIFNILVFHIIMLPLGIFPGLVLLGLWLIVAFSAPTSRTVARLKDSIDETPLRIC